MKSAEFGLEAAAAQQEGSRAAYYPRLDLELRVDRDGNIGGVDGKRDTNSVMLVGSWNLVQRRFRPSPRAWPWRNAERQPKNP